MLNRLADLIRTRATADAAVQSARAVAPIGGREIQTGALRATSDAEVQPVQPVAPIGGRDFEPGAIVRGQVIAALPRGVFEVRIEDRTYMLQLPYQAKRGDQLELVVTARDPQLKFALSQRADGISSARDFEVGSIVRGQVTAALQRGVFEVRIEDRAFMLRLPYQAERGDQLELVVTAGEPQLKFALSQRADGTSSATRLSETAHFVSSLLRGHGELPLAEGARVREPLLASPEVNSRDIAVSLKQALAHSGIFYEAHQAEWVAGNRPLADLLQEPQARLDLLQENNERRTNDALQPRSDTPVHREALAIVRQQLETLDTRHLAWNGVVWPGQTMDWEVSEQPQSAKSGAEEQQWRTNLRLDLPRLGRVNASLAVTPSGVTIMLHAESAESVAAMTEHHVTLSRALHAAGVTPLDILVRKDDHT